MRHRKDPFDRDMEGGWENVVVRAQGSWLRFTDRNGDLTQSVAAAAPKPTRHKKRWRLLPVRS
jgi:hypothetical protein